MRSKSLCVDVLLDTILSPIVFLTGDSLIFLTIALKCFREAVDMNLASINSQYQENCIKAAAMMNR